MYREGRTRRQVVDFSRITRERDMLQSEMAILGTPHDWAISDPR